MREDDLTTEFKAALLNAGTLAVIHVGAFERTIMLCSAGASATRGASAAVGASAPLMAASSGGDAGAA